MSCNVQGKIGMKTWCQQNGYIKEVIVSAAIVNKVYWLEINITLNSLNKHANKSTTLLIPIESNK